jgi:L-2-hydroxyglutarate oxidase LhgO
VIIGAGFFGAVLADYLSNRPEFSKVAVVEMETGPLQRSSARNQARIHQGYHYPRSIATAEASRRTYSSFKKNGRQQSSQIFGTSMELPAMGPGSLRSSSQQQ